MKRFIFILGGTRSGKSKFAVSFAKKLGRKVVFIATAAPSDKEMKKRIKMHKASRPKYWKLIEEGREVNSVLLGLKNRYEVVLIDCLGLLVSNLLADNLKEREIERKIKTLIKTILKVRQAVVVVSNEVGSSVIPVNPLARKFTDILGFSNQMMAKYADEVIFMQAGIPLRIKGGKKDAEIK